MEKNVLVENVIKSVREMVKVVEERVKLNEMLAGIDDRLVDYEQAYNKVRTAVTFISENASDEDTRAEAESILELLNGDGYSLYNQLIGEDRDVDSSDVDILNSVIDKAGALKCPELTLEEYEKFAEA